ncbi:MAG: class I SAM-dependent methyltransferase [Magnetospirillum sp.]|nr:MAG: class I SAM-dependent methyltransferase [Magnetospirillum sp.]
MGPEAVIPVERAEAALDAAERFVRNLALLLEPPYRRNPDVIVETIDVAGRRVVDVGCGDGSLARHLVAHGAFVLGVECSPRQLAKAAKAEKHANVEIVAGIGQALPAADASADVVVFANSLHHIPPEFMAASLAEAARVLKPGGLVYVSEPLPEGPFFEAVRPIDDETRVRALALAAIDAAGAHGLVLERRFTYVHPVRMRSYDAFRERIISANAEREARFQTQDAEMRALFARTAIPAEDGGFGFDQPMRVDVLKKASV